jgi:hypothetical protein
VIRRALPSIVFALAATWPALARAQATPAPVTPGSDVAQAEALFNEAKELRDAGRFAEACPKFAESRRLGPGIGVTLHLADCYEKVGKTQSAWTEFRNAEKLAREREDKRADVASARAQALEPRLNRLTLVVPVAAGQAGPEVIFDGSALPPDHLNVAEPVDPGDHEVKITSPGRATRALIVHVDPSILSTTIPIGDAEATPAPPPPSPIASGTTAVPVGDPGATRRWVGVGLIVAGAASAGVGAWLITSKVQEYMTDGQPCDSRLRTGAVPGAAVLFGAGGVAAVTGIVLIVTAHRSTEIAMTPLALPGGGGALLSGTF